MTWKACHPVRTLVKGDGVLHDVENVSSHGDGHERCWVAPWQDGVWEGERLLPEGWVKFSTTASPQGPNYGGGWWVNISSTRKPSSSSGLTRNAGAASAVVVPSLMSTSTVIIVLSRTSTSTVVVLLPRTSTSNVVVIPSLAPTKSLPLPRVSQVMSVVVVHIQGATAPCSC